MTSSFKVIGNFSQVQQSISPISCHF